MSTKGCLRPDGPPCTAAAAALHLAAVPPPRSADDDATTLGALIKVDDQSSRRRATVRFFQFQEDSPKEERVNSNEAVTSVSKKCTYFTSLKRVLKTYSVITWRRDDVKSICLFDLHDAPFRSCWNGCNVDWLIWDEIWETRIDSQGFWLNKKQVHGKNSSTCKWTSFVKWQSHNCHQFGTLQRFVAHPRRNTHESQIHCSFKR